MKQTMASVVIAVAMSLLTAFMVGIYWLMLVLFTGLRMLLLPFRALMKTFAKKTA